LSRRLAVALTDESELLDVDQTEHDLIDVQDTPLSLPLEVPPAPEDGGPNPLGVVRRLFPGGSGTRGRPPIVYTPTQLETTLLPVLRTGPQTLVVLSGNAGDGKTAFIETALRASGTPVVGGTNEYHILLEGHPYFVVLDGSEDSATRTNDDLLTNAFGRFRGDAPVLPDRGTIIAINKGRLLNFLETHRDEYEFLWRVVTNRFVGGTVLAGHEYVLIDLNDRSVLAPDSTSSIFAGIARRLGEWDAWERECRKCDAIDVCPARFNAMALRSPRVREQMWKTLAAADLDDRVHVTVRHIVTKLATSVVGDARCPDVRSQARSGRTFLPSNFLYTSLFATRSGDAHAEAAAMDRIVAAYDPTEQGAPRRDRQVAYLVLRGALQEVLGQAGETPDLAGLKAQSWAIASSSIDEEPPAGEPEYRLRVLDLVRHASRRMYLLEPDHPLAPADPVATMDDFIRIGRGDADDQLLLTRLIASLNATLGIEPGRFQELLAPRDYSEGLRGTGFAAMVPRSRFALAPANALGNEYEERPYLEAWPRALRLAARDVDGVVVAAIALPLLMFEVIDRAGRGFRPTSQTERSYIVRLNGFYRRLAEHAWLEQPTYALYERGQVRARATIQPDLIAFAEA